MEVGLAACAACQTRGIVELVRYMRGFYLKAAQLVSTRDDFLCGAQRFMEVLQVFGQGASWLP